VHILTGEKIKAAIKRKLSAVSLSANEVLAIMADHAARSFDDFLDIDSSGKWSVNLAKAKRRGVLHLLANIAETEHGTRAELTDPFRALVQLGKYHGLWDRESTLAAIARHVKARRLAYDAAQSGGNGKGAGDGDSTV
jgi:hypothetical protein